MKKTIEWVMFLIVFVCLAFAGQECANCKCREYPVPNECVKCCGVAKGVVSARATASVTVKTADGAEQTFAVTNETVFRGTFSAGSSVTVVYNKETNTAGLIQGE